MRIVRDIGYVKKRSRNAKLMVFAGLLLLGGSWLLTVFLPERFFVALLGLATGFVLFNAGMQQVSRWTRRPRSDMIIDHELNRLNDRFTLIHHPALPGRRPDHVLVSPGGVLVMTSREVHGRMSVKGRQWRKHDNPLLRMFMLGGPQLGNPTYENEAQVKSVTNVLESEDFDELEVTGAVVFVHDSVEVEINDATLAVLHVSELNDYARAELGTGPLTSNDRERIVVALSRGDQLERSTDAPIRPRTRKRVKAA